jgi:hypothetical protein
MKKIETEGEIITDGRQEVTRYTYKIFVGRSHVKRPLVIGLYGWIILKWLVEK